MRKLKNPLLRVVHLVFLCLLLGSSARLALYLLNLESFAELSGRELCWAFWGGIRFDAAGCLPVLAGPLLCLLLPLPRSLHERWQLIWSWISFVCLVFLSLAFLASVLYFAQAGRHLADEVAQLQNDSAFLLSYALNAHGLLCFIVLLSICLAGLAWQRWIVLAPTSRPSLLKHCLPLVLALILGIRGSVFLKPLATIDAYGSGKRAMGTLMLNGVFVAGRALLTYNEIERQQLDPQALRQALLPLGIDEQQAQPFAKNIRAYPQRRNIVVILLESWSHLYVDSFAHRGFNATPFFDALASKSRRYTNYFANGTRSIEAIQLALTGVPPLKGLPTIDQGLVLGERSRIGVLGKERGYSSIFVQSSKRRSFHLDAVAHSLGFGAYYGWEDAPLLQDYTDPTAPQFGWDYESFMMLGSKIKQLPQPFFAFMFTGTTHTPFALPPQSCRQHPHDLDSEGGFLNTLCYADESLRAFFEQSREEPWFKDTLFIITADHTLGAYRHHTFEERHRVPLLIYDPREERGDDEDKFASHMDLFPSVLALMGGAEAVSTLGEPLWEKGEGRVLVSGRYDHSGLLSPRGYLLHSFSRVIETTFPSSEEASQAFLLLALEHSAFGAIRSQRW